MPRGKPNQDPHAVCSRCGQPKPVVKMCSAHSKQTGEPCGNPAAEGWNVCKFHGKGGGGPSKNFRYAKAVEHNPALKEAYAEIEANEPDEFDLSDEITLARARVHAAIAAGTVDLKTETAMLSDLTKAVQKNVELRIRMQGLVQKSDAEAMLRQAVKVIVRFVPDNLKAGCFEELAKVLTGGGGMLAGAIGSGHE